MSRRMGVEGVFALEGGGRVSYVRAPGKRDSFSDGRRPTSLILPGINAKDRRTMNKGELIEAIASNLGESKATAARALDGVLLSLTHGIQKDGKVSIAGFGTFRKKDRKERTAINPATKEPMHIPASSTVGFTPSQSLKESMQVTVSGVA